MKMNYYLDIKIYTVEDLKEKNLKENENNKMFGCM